MFSKWTFLMVLVLIMISEVDSRRRRRRTRVSTRNSPKVAADANMTKRQRMVDMRESLADSLSTDRVKVFLLDNGKPQLVKGRSAIRRMSARYKEMTTSQVLRLMLLLEKRIRAVDKLVTSDSRQTSNVVTQSLPRSRTVDSTSRVQTSGDSVRPSNDFAKRLLVNGRLRAPSGSLGRISVPPTSEIVDRGRISVPRAQKSQSVRKTTGTKRESSTRRPFISARFSPSFEERLRHSQRSSRPGGLVDARQVSNMRHAEDRVQPSSNRKIQTGVRNTGILDTSTVAENIPQNDLKQGPTWTDIDLRNRAPNTPFKDFLMSGRKSDATASGAVDSVTSPQQESTVKEKVDEVGGVIRNGRMKLTSNQSTRTHNEVTQIKETHTSVSKKNTNAISNPSGKGDTPTQSPSNLSTDQTSQKASTKIAISTNYEKKTTPTESAVQERPQEEPTIPVLTVPSEPKTTKITLIDSSKGVSSISTAHSNLPPTNETPVTPKPLTDQKTTNAQSSIFVESKEKSTKNEGVEIPTQNTLGNKPSSTSVTIMNIGPTNEITGTQMTLAERQVSAQIPKPKIEAPLTTLSTPEVKKSPPKTEQALLTQLQEMISKHKEQETVRTGSAASHDEQLKLMKQMLLEVAGSSTHVPAIQVVKTTPTPLSQIMQLLKAQENIVAPSAPVPKPSVSSNIFSDVISILQAKETQAAKQASMNAVSHIPQQTNFNSNHMMQQHQRVIDPYEQQRMAMTHMGNPMAGMLGGMMGYMNPEMMQELMFGDTTDAPDPVKPPEESYKKVEEQEGVTTAAPTTTEPSTTTVTVAQPLRHRTPLKLRPRQHTLYEPTSGTYVRDRRPTTEPGWQEIDVPHLDSQYGGHMSAVKQTYPPTRPTHFDAKIRKQHQHKENKLRTQQRRKGHLGFDNQIHKKIDPNMLKSIKASIDRALESAGIAKNVELVLTHESETKAKPTTTTPPKGNIILGRVQASLEKALQSAGISSNVKLVLRSKNEETRKTPIVTNAPARTTKLVLKPTDPSFITKEGSHVTDIQTDPTTNIVNEDLHGGMSFLSYSERPAKIPADSSNHIFVHHNVRQPKYKNNVTPHPFDSLMIGPITTVSTEYKSPSAKGLPKNVELLGGFSLQKNPKEKSNQLNGGINKLQSEPGYKDNAETGWQVIPMNLYTPTTETGIKQASKAKPDMTEPIINEHPSTIARNQVMPIVKPAAQVSPEATMQKTNVLQKSTISPPQSDRSFIVNKLMSALSGSKHQDLIDTLSKFLIDKQGNHAADSKPQPNNVEQTTDTRKKSAASEQQKERKDVRIVLPPPALVLSQAPNKLHSTQNHIISEPSEPMKSNDRVFVNMNSIPNIYHAPNTRDTVMISTAGKNTENSRPSQGQVLDQHSAFSLESMKTNAEVQQQSTHKNIRNSDPAVFPSKSPRMMHAEKENTFSGADLFQRQKPMPSPQTETYPEHHLKQLTDDIRHHRDGATKPELTRSTQPKVSKNEFTNINLKANVLNLSTNIPTSTSSDLIPPSLQVSTRAASRFSSDVPAVTSTETRSDNNLSSDYKIARKVSSEPTFPDYFQTVRPLEFPATVTLPTTQYLESEKNPEIVSPKLEDAAYKSNPLIYAPNKNSDSSISSFKRSSSSQDQVKSSSSTQTPNFVDNTSTRYSTKEQLRVDNAGDDTSVPLLKNNLLNSFSDNDVSMLKSIAEKKSPSASSSDPITMKESTVQYRVKQSETTPRTFLPTTKTTAFTETVFSKPIQFHDLPSHLFKEAYMHDQENADSFSSYNKIPDIPGKRLERIKKSSGAAFSSRFWTPLGKRISGKNMATGIPILMNVFAPTVSEKKKMKQPQRKKDKGLTGLANRIKFKRRHKGQILFDVSRHIKNRATAAPRDARKEKQKIPTTVTDPKRTLKIPTRRITRVREEASPKKHIDKNQLHLNLGIQQRRKISLAMFNRLRTQPLGSRRRQASEVQHERGQQISPAKTSRRTNIHRSALPPVAPTRRNPSFDGRFNHRMNPANGKVTGLPVQIQRHEVGNEKINVGGVDGASGISLLSDKSVDKKPLSSENKETFSTFTNVQHLNSRNSFNTTAKRTTDNEWRTSQHVPSIPSSLLSMANMKRPSARNTNIKTKNMKDSQNKIGIKERTSLGLIAGSKSNSAVVDPNNSPGGDENMEIEEKRPNVPVIDYEKLTLDILHTIRPNLNPAVIKIDATLTEATNAVKGKNSDQLTLAPPYLKSDVLNTSQGETILSPQTSQTTAVLMPTPKVSPKVITTPKVTVTTAASMRMPQTSPVITYPQTTTPVIRTTQTTTPEVTIPQTTTPEVTTPKTTTPEVTIPQTTTPEVTIPKTTIPEVTIPQTTTPVVTIPQTTTPVVTTPKTTPVVTIPQTTTPEVTTPKTTPVVTIPQTTTPVVTIPQTTTPVVTTPKTTPVVTIPQTTTPEVTTPKTTPVVTIPQTTTPVVTIPQTTTPEVTTQHITTPEEITSQKTTRLIKSPTATQMAITSATQVLEIKNGDMSLSDAAMYQPVSSIIQTIGETKPKTNEDILKALQSSLKPQQLLSPALSRGVSYRNTRNQYRDIQFENKDNMNPLGDQLQTQQQQDWTRWSKPVAMEPVLQEFRSPANVHQRTRIRQINRKQKTPEKITYVGNRYRKSQPSFVGIPDRQHQQRQSYQKPTNPQVGVNSRPGKANNTFASMANIRYQNIERHQTLNQGTNEPSAREPKKSFNDTNREIATTSTPPITKIKQFLQTIFASMDHHDNQKPEQSNNLKEFSQQSLVDKETSTIPTRRQSSRGSAVPRLVPTQGSTAPRLVLTQGSKAPQFVPTQGFSAPRVVPTSRSSVPRLVPTSRSSVPRLVPTLRSTVPRLVPTHGSSVPQHLPTHGSAVSRHLPTRDFSVPRHNSAVPKHLPKNISTKLRHQQTRGSAIRTPNDHNERPSQFPLQQFKRQETILKRNKMKTHSDSLKFGGKSWQLRPQSVVTNKPYTTSVTRRPVMHASRQVSEINPITPSTTMQSSTTSTLSTTTISVKSLLMKLFQQEIRESIKAILPSQATISKPMTTTTRAPSTTTPPATTTSTTTTTPAPVTTTVIKTPPSPKGSALGQCGSRKMRYHCEGKDMFNAMPSIGHWCVGMCLRGSCIESVCSCNVSCESTSAQSKEEALGSAISSALTGQSTDTGSIEQALQSLLATLEMGTVISPTATLRNNKTTASTVAPTSSYISYEQFTSGPLPVLPTSKPVTTKVPSVSGLLASIERLIDAKIKSIKPSTTKAPLLDAEGERIEQEDLPTTTTTTVRPPPPQHQYPPPPTPTFHESQGGWERRDHPAYPRQGQRQKWHDRRQPQRDSWNRRSRPYERSGWHDPSWDSPSRMTEAPLEPRWGGGGGEGGGGENGRGRGDRWIPREANMPSGEFRRRNGPSSRHWDMTPPSPTWQDNWHRERGPRRDWGPPDRGGWAGDRTTVDPRWGEPGFRRRRGRSFRRRSAYGGEAAEAAD